MLGTRNNMEMIDGVTITPLQQFSDYRGKVMKFAYSTAANNEAYFSVIHPGMVKAWHLHKEMDLNYVCVYGKVLLVLKQMQANKPLVTMEICLSPDDYKLVHIPAGIYNGFKGLGTTDSIIANLASIPHRDDEIIRFPVKYFQFDWFRIGE